VTGIIGALRRDCITERDVERSRLFACAERLQICTGVCAPRPRGMSSVEADSADMPTNCSVRCRVHPPRRRAGNAACYRVGPVRLCRELDSPATNHPLKLSQGASARERESARLPALCFLHLDVVQ
jgi:hypothetical protein